MKSLQGCKIVKALVALFLAVLILVGCQKDPYSNSNESPVDQPKIYRTAEQLKFLTSKIKRLNKSFSTQQFITKAQGGTITAGDDTSGYSSLYFKRGDVPQDTLITFKWDSQGYITDLFPHGIVFNSPVEIILSYKHADLTGIDESKLHIWYYDENVNKWELIGGKVDTTNKVIKGYIHHFSRYAVASD
jgi:Ni,Fe-hydrogenase I large subunit